MVASSVIDAYDSQATLSRLLRQITSSMGVKSEDRKEEEGGVMGEKREMAPQAKISRNILEDCVTQTNNEHDVHPTSDDDFDKELKQPHTKHQSKEDNQAPCSIHPWSVNSRCLWDSCMPVSFAIM